MLKITIPRQEFFDEVNLRFIETNGATFLLEHSLLSISKWESRWKKSFIHTTDKTKEEIVDYIRCMTITNNIDFDVYNYLTQANFKLIEEYIAHPMTATTFSNIRKGPQSREIVTSEVIYYWMVTLQIPFEAQKWHLNRLLTLIRVCDIKQQPTKKQNRTETMRQNAQINASRRAARKGKR